MEAKEQLEKAQSPLNALKQQEEQLADMVEANDTKVLAGLIHKRAEVLELVAKVKPLNSSRPMLKDAHILSLRRQNDLALSTD